MIPILTFGVTGHASADYPSGLRSIGQSALDIAFDFAPAPADLTGSATMAGVWSSPVGYLQSFIFVIVKGVPTVCWHDNNGNTVVIVATTAVSMTAGAWYTARVITDQTAGTAAMYFNTMGGTQTSITSSRTQGATGINIGTALQDPNSGTSPTFMIGNVTSDDNQFQGSMRGLRISVGGTEVVNTTVPAAYALSDSHGLAWTLGGGTIIQAGNTTYSSDGTTTSTGGTNPVMSQLTLGTTGYAQAFVPNGLMYIGQKQLDVAVDFAPTVADLSATEAVLAGVWGSSGYLQSFALELGSGIPRIVWHDNGPDYTVWQPSSPPTLTAGTWYTLRVVTDQPDGKATVYFGPLGDTQTALAARLDPIGIWAAGTIDIGTASQDPNGNVDPRLVIGQAVGGIYQFQGTVQGVRISVSGTQFVNTAATSSNTLSDTHGVTWTIGGGAVVSPPRSATPSFIIYNAGGQVTDADNNTATINGLQQVVLNGTADDSTSGVIEVAAVGGKLYQLNGANNWYVNSTGVAGNWVQTSNPANLPQLASISSATPSNLPTGPATTGNATPYGVTLAIANSNVLDWTFGSSIGGATIPNRAALDKQAWYEDIFNETNQSTYISNFRQYPAYMTDGVTPDPRDVHPIHGDHIELVARSWLGGDLDRQNTGTYLGAPFIAGYMRPAIQFVPGMYAEICCMWPALRWCWPTFWMFPGRQDYGSTQQYYGSTTPTNPLLEIDCFDGFPQDNAASVGQTIVNGAPLYLDNSSPAAYGNPQDLFVSNKPPYTATSSGGSGQVINFDTNAASNPTTDYHHYAIDWRSNNRILWIYDGILVRDQELTYPTQYGSTSNGAALPNNLQNTMIPMFVQIDHQFGVIFNGQDMNALKTAAPPIRGSYRIKSVRVWNSSSTLSVP